ncbi:MAG: hypothetical protein ACR2MW_12470 [Chthoniobacterales bacterium]
MHGKPPRVPPAAQLAFSGTQGARVLPGEYTVRLTKDNKPYETKLTVGLDRRAKFTDEDRKAQLAAALKVRELFGDESALMDRIIALRAGLAKGLQALPAGDPVQQAVKDFDGKADAVRKQIVATTEGGAITGEERLREHTDQLYGAILSYEGKPADYQIARIDSLRRELGDATKDFENLLTNDLPKLNEQLKAKGQPAIEPPAAKVAQVETEPMSGGTLTPASDPDQPASLGAALLPASFRLLH